MTWPKIWAQMYEDAKANGELQHEEEDGLCRVYWRTHGCCLPREHKGQCRCDCGDQPQPDELFYGVDAAPRGLPLALDT